MSKETLLGYVVLLIGVIVGGALVWLWGSIRERWRKNKSINLNIQTYEIVDAEYVDGKFRIIRKEV